ncbi:hypothetical protein [Agromyces sp. ZXT2-3]|uniref:hypothetical protein n=1 Tax=Agromyces sp. ZXT2-3 TaxID=3461152 RepID=UPI004054A88E
MAVLNKYPLSPLVYLVVEPTSDGRYKIFASLSTKAAAERVLESYRRADRLHGSHYGADNWFVQVTRLPSVRAAIEEGYIVPGGKIEWAAD